ncbi:MAG: hypothetical protein QNJ15_06180 [Erythrobacter sp.]|nr:hypothetical protein [Erythrobacter sp.]
MSRLSNSRFNPKPGIKDFWNEFRKPNPYRWPMLIASSLPFAVIFYWLSTETVYKTPDRPSITYITTFDPNRTDEEIVATNLENQEVKELREQAEEDLAQRKRDLYKALGAATGMDVDAIEARADAERAAREAEEEARREEMFGRQADAGQAPEGNTGEEGSAP